MSENPQDAKAHELRKLIKSTHRRSVARLMNEPKSRTDEAQQIATAIHDWAKGSNPPEVPSVMAARVLLSMVAIALEDLALAHLGDLGLEDDDGR